MNETLNKSPSLKRKSLQWVWKSRVPILKGIGVLTLLVLLADAISFFPVEDGFRTGYIRNFSKSGMVCKTYEGELDQRIGGGGMYHEQDIFNFTALPKAVVELDKAERSGKRVTIHFKQRLFKLFWRGDTKIFVDDVEFEE